MKTYIAFNLSQKSSGGGNQFLNNLRGEFIKKNVYSDSANNAEVILFNAHHNSTEALKLRHKFPEKTFIHRIDGLYKLYNNSGDERQDMSFAMNISIANATVFQSNWAREKHIEEGLELQGKPNKVISNAADNEIFFPHPSHLTQESPNKINIISTGWSSNPNKGTSFYKYLDDHLDFSKYTLTFVGNPPAKLKNIKTIPPLDRKELANELKSKDLFFFPSRHECCSNSLIEGVSCGLVAVALDSGGNTELINKCNAGVLFNSEEDLIAKIEEASRNVKERRGEIKAPNLNEVSDQYIKFFKECIE
jgi:glycosyltransferase involved in cell wall biosynthesis